MSDCNCTLRERLVGDGCEVCNPELAKELAEDLEKSAEAGGKEGA